MLGSGSHGNEIEIVTKRAERLVGQYLIHCNACVLIEKFRLLRGISLSNYGNINAFVGRTAFEKLPVRDIAHRLLAYEYVLGVNAVLETGGDFTLETEKGNTYHSLCRRHRKQEHIFERLPQPGSLLGALPLLKEGGERGHIEHLLTLCIPHHNLSVALARHTVQIVSAAGPSLEAGELANCYLSGAGCTCKDIIHS